MRRALTKTSTTKMIAVLASLILVFNFSVLSQSSSVAPPPAPERWRGLIGEYGTDKAILYILESNGKLCASFARAEPLCLTEVSNTAFKFPAGGQHANEQVTFTRDAKGHASEV